MTDRSIAPPSVALTAAVALVLHSIFWPIVMDDVANDYVPWLMHIVDTGPIAAFAAPFGSYNPPYLYLLALVSPLAGVIAPASLVKLVSLAGAVALAVATARLLRTLAVPHAARWGTVVLVLPSVVLNAALMGQSDALWAAPCLAALDAAIGRRHRTMLFWCGIAMAFKIQALLFAPFIIAVLIRQRVPVYFWLIPPLVFVAALVPAWACGWPASDLATLYFRQAGTFPALSLNAPNLWFVVQSLFPAIAPGLSGLALAAAVGATGCYIARFAATMPAGARMLPVAAFAILITVGLLPHMHERYFLVADIVAFAWAVTSGTRRVWVTAGLVQAGSALSIGSYVFGAPVLVILGFAAMAIASYRVATTLWPVAASDTPLMARTVPLPAGGDESGAVQMWIARP